MSKGEGVFAGAAVGNDIAGVGGTDSANIADVVCVAVAVVFGGGDKGVGDIDEGVVVATVLGSAELSVGGVRDVVVAADVAVVGIVNSTDVVVVGSGINVVNSNVVVDVVVGGIDVVVVEGDDGAGAVARAAGVRVAVDVVVSGGVDVVVVENGVVVTVVAAAVAGVGVGADGRILATFARSV